MRTDTYRGERWCLRYEEDGENYYFHRLTFRHGRGFEGEKMPIDGSFSGAKLWDNENEARKFMVKLSEEGYSYSIIEVGMEMWVIE